jgi:hypothetical protein
MAARRDVPVVAIVLALCAAAACQLRRPDTVPSRMIEPQFEEPDRGGGVAPPSTKAVPIRLLDTQARGHIGRRVLHLQANGELVEDAIWRWSSAPDRYLDTALRLELTTRSDVRLVDVATAPSVAVTLLAWHLDSTGGSRLVGAVELQYTGPDRVVRSQVVRAAEPVSDPLPGNLASAAGRLLRRLASESATRVTRESTANANHP